MAVTITCDECDRRDVFVSDHGPNLRGWVVRDDRRLCQACAATLPPRENLDDAGERELAEGAA